MTNQQLETFLFQYTESEQRHLREQPPQLSPRYRNIPKVVYNGGRCTSSISEAF